jgi:hypothetical protein
MHRRYRQSADAPEERNRAVLLSTCTDAYQPPASSSAKKSVVRAMNRNDPM